IRGEQIAPASLAGLPAVLDIPAELRPWEPDYPPSTYSDAGAVHPEPPSTGTPVAAELVEPLAVVDDASTELAVRQLVEAWTTQSTGRAEVMCVEGTAGAAFSALG